MGEQEQHGLLTSPLPSFDDMDEDFDEFLELAAASDDENNKDDNLIGVPSAVDDRYTIPTYNAVHMEIQENAKLPTFNMNVDRSNSSDLRRRGMQPCSPTTRREIEEMMRLSENDFSLTEVFLKSNRRASQNMNYSAAGSLLPGSLLPGSAEPTNVAVPEKRTIETPNGKTEQIASIMTHSGTKTTPNGVNAVNGISHVVSTNGLSNGVSNGISNGMHPVSDVSSHSMTNPMSCSSPAVIGTNQPYYTRPHQLPIPNASTGTPTPAPQASAIRNGVLGTMAAALATAAALVPKETLPDTKQLAEAVPHTATPSPTPLQQSTTVAPIAARSTFSYPPPRSSAAYPYSRLNAAGPTPQMADATKRRSQFGFGGNHQVPCVPLPPQRVSAKSTTTTTAAKKKKQASPPPVRSLPPPVEIPVPIVNAGPAYERKKQRAKDARVKLNESIEKLAVSISLAGSQSAQRALSTSTTTGSNSLCLSAHTKQAMLTCAATADTAKKWDRPAFVGSAATLIQELNAQCEALVRELEELSTKHANSDVNENDDAQMNGGKRMVGDDNEEEFDDQDNKRRKTTASTTSEAAVVSAVWNDITIMGVIASYMDPHSLLRGQCACKNMHHVFSNDALWLDRCIQRFGLYMVRQWQEKLSVDDEDDGEVPSTSSSPSSLSPIKLYEQMDALNAQPISGNPSAQTRMPHLVSAWVSIVERSNGETSRSVLQPDGRYTSTPVVELRILVQNTGSSTAVFLIPNQDIVIDASTRRRGEEWKEVTSDERFRKRVVRNINLLQQHLQHPHDDENDHSNRDDRVSKAQAKDMATPLYLYESRVVIVHVHCKGCSTASKFQQRANFLKVLVQVNGTTIPLVIPFFRESLIVSTHSSSSKF